MGLFSGQKEKVVLTPLDTGELKFFESALVKETPVTGNQPERRPVSARYGTLTHSPEKTPDTPFVVPYEVLRAKVEEIEEKRKHDDISEDERDLLQLYREQVDAQTPISEILAMPEELAPAIVIEAPVAAEVLPEHNSTPLTGLTPPALSQPRDNVYVIKKTTEETFKMSPGIWEKMGPAGVSAFFGSPVTAPNNVAPPQPIEAPVIVPSPPAEPSPKVMPVEARSHEQNRDVAVSIVGEVQSPSTEIPKPSAWMLELMKQGAADDRGTLKDDGLPSPDVAKHEPPVIRPAQQTPPAQSTASEITSPDPREHFLKASDRLKLKQRLNTDGQGAQGATRGVTRNPIVTGSQRSSVRPRSVPVPVPSWEDIMNGPSDAKADAPKVTWKGIK